MILYVCKNITLLIAPKLWKTFSFNFYKQNCCDDFDNICVENRFWDPLRFGINSPVCYLSSGHKSVKNIVFLTFITFSPSLIFAKLSTNLHFRDVYKYMYEKYFDTKLILTGWVGFISQSSTAPLSSVRTQQNDKCLHNTKR